MYLDIEGIIMEIEANYNDPKRIIAEIYSIKSLYNKGKKIQILPQNEKIEITYKTHYGREEYVRTKYKNGKIIIQELYEIFPSVNRASKIYLNKSNPNNSTAKGIEVKDGKCEWTFFEQPKLPEIKGFDFLKGGYVYYNGYQMRDSLLKKYKPFEKKLIGMGYKSEITATMGGPHVPYSAHWNGMAIDIVLDKIVTTKKGKKKYIPVEAREAKKVVEKAASHFGGKYEEKGWYNLGNNLYLLDEYNWISPHWTGPHFHVEYVPAGVKGIPNVYRPYSCEDPQEDYVPRKEGLLINF